jgi:trimethylamine---corrinoid protein Co-methyltransferase
MERKMLHIPILDESKIQAIHEATLRILSETGILISHSEGRSLLLDHGAQKHQDRVLIPAELVERCLNQLPKTITFSGRDPEKAITFSTGTCFAHNVGGVPNVYDSDTNSRRAATRQDVIEATRLLDALPNAASITPLYTPQDVPVESFTLWMTYDTLKNTTKPFRAPGIQTAQELHAIAEMFAIACPEGVVTVGISPISPLTFPEDITAAILAAAQRGMTLGSLPCPIMGATAPMTIAGAVAQQNAEVLATIVLAQLAHPGLPMIYKGRLSVMDPRSGLSVWGNPEIGLISAATVAMGHHYGLPVNVYGFSTNAHSVDVQSGYERALNMLIPVLANANDVSGIGEMEGGVSSSLAQIVIDDEILNNITRLRRGFEINDDALALEVIDSVMNGSRNFLIEDHTLQNLRSGDVMLPKLAVRDNWEAWEQGGKRGMLEVAEMKAQELLRNHEVPPLSDAQVKELDRVIQAFEKEQIE